MSVHDLLAQLAVVLGFLMACDVAWDVAHNWWGPRVFRRERRRTWARRRQAEQLRLVTEGVRRAAELFATMGVSARQATEAFARMTAELRKAADRW